MTLAARTIEPPRAALDATLGVPVRHLHLERPWGAQHVVEAGPRSGTPVLLVHGWPQHWFAWRHVLTALGREARLVAVDMRGFGWSSGTPSGSVAELAGDLVAVVEELRLGTVHLVAHDWGGWIGFRAALDHPDLVGTYQALSVVPPWLDRRAMLRHLPDWSYVGAMAAAGRAVARCPVAVRWLVDHSTHGSPWEHGANQLALRSYVARVGRPGAAAMTQHLYAALVRHELPAALGPRPRRLRVPTTVVVGEHETISRPELFWSRTLPGELRVVTVPGARHWLAEEKPRAVVDHLRRVL